MGWSTQLLKRLAPGRQLVMVGGAVGVYGRLVATVSATRMTRQPWPGGPPGESKSSGSISAKSAALMSSAHLASNLSVLAMELGVSPGAYMRMFGSPADNSTRRAYSSKNHSVSWPRCRARPTYPNGRPARSPGRYRPRDQSAGPASRMTSATTNAWTVPGPQLPGGSIFFGSSILYMLISSLVLIEL